MNWKTDIDMPSGNPNRKQSYCLLCDEQIDTPLCPNCIAAGFKQWIQRFPKKVEEQLQKKTDVFLKNYKILGNQHFKCISCNQLGSPICPDCFTDFLYQICLEEGLSVSDLREFLLIFDFNFHKRRISNKGFPKLSETH